VKDAAARSAIEYLREWHDGRAVKNEASFRASVSYVEQHIESLEYELNQASDALTSTLENSRLAEKLAAAEEVIDTAREWRAAAVEADKRAVEAENRLRLTQQELNYAKRRAQENENARTTLAHIAIIIEEHNATGSN